MQWGASAATRTCVDNQDASTPRLPRTSITSLRHSYSAYCLSFLTTDFLSTLGWKLSEKQNPCSDAIMLKVTQSHLELYHVTKQFYRCDAPSRWTDKGFIKLKWLSDILVSNFIRIVTWTTQCAKLVYSTSICMNLCYYSA